MNTRRTAKSHRLFVCILAAACYLPATESKPDEPDKADKAATDSMVGKKAGEVRDDNGLKMKLVWCPPGFVTMEQVEQAEQPVSKDDEAGNDDPKSKPAPKTFGETALKTARKTRTTTKISSVKVFVTRGYWLGKFEVTQAEWKQVMATEPWKGKDSTKEGDDFPATWVNWKDAMEFCHKLTERERKAGRVPEGWEHTLPTDAQWERGCRARTETTFNFGDDESKLGEYAWFFDNSTDAGEQCAHRVGQKKPNPWGLHDMHGNVSEWCRDWYGVKLPGGRDPEVIVEKDQDRHVIRSGGWDFPAVLCRSANRIGLGQFDRSSNLGFRVALSPSVNK